MGAMDADQLREVLDLATSLDPFAGLANVVQISDGVLSDPAIVGFFAEHKTYRDVMYRLRRILIGDDAGPEARIETAMLFAAISGAVIHPTVVDLDDDVLRAQLTRLARRFLGLPM